MANFDFEDQIIILKFDGITILKDGHSNHKWCTKTIDLNGIRNDPCDFPFQFQLPNVTFFMTTGLIEIYLLQNFVFVVCLDQFIQVIMALLEISFCWNLVFSCFVWTEFIHVILLISYISFDTRRSVFFYFSCKQYNFWITEVLCNYTSIITHLVIQNQYA